jgi:hypothetical protein
MMIDNRGENMILRKPYAFLIKNFKKIHLLLAIMMGFVEYKTSHLLSYLNKYITEGWLLHSDIKISDYIDWLFIIIIILIIGISVVISILMRVKQKPQKYYILSIGIYIGLLIVLFVAYGDLETIIREIIDPRKIRLTRDLVFIVSLVQYVLIFMAVIRASGFNIKKFNFEEDIDELNISEADSEEMELTLGIDTRRIRQRIRRKQREIRYFILENFTTIIVLSVLTIGGIGAIVYLDHEVYNKIYKEGELIETKDYTLIIPNTFNTTKNYRGAVVAPNDYTYLVTEINIKNKLNNNIKINPKDFELLTYEGKFFPVLNRYKSFFDLGIGYNNQVIEPNKANNYIIVFEIPIKALNNEMLIRYADSIFDKKQKIVRVSSENISPINREKSVSIGDTLSLSTSIMKNSDITIKSIDFSDRFEYLYNDCQTTCVEKKGTILPNFLTNYDKTILKLDVVYNLDKNLNLSEINNSYKFIDTFGIIKYIYNNKYKIHTLDLINLTPKNNKDNNIYIEVLEELKNASKIELILTIRNKQYTYVLKGE